MSLPLASDKTKRKKQKKEEGRLRPQAPGQEPEGPRLEVPPHPNDVINTITTATATATATTTTTTTTTTIMIIIIQTTNNNNNNSNTSNTNNTNNTNNTKIKIKQNTMTKNDTNNTSNTNNTNTKHLDKEPQGHADQTILLIVPLLFVWEFKVLHPQHYQIW